MTRLKKKEKLSPYLHNKKWLYAFFRCIYGNNSSKFVLINFSIKTETSYAHIIVLKFLSHDYYLSLLILYNFYNYDVNCV